MNAPCFDGTDLLVAADCTAFSFGAMHEKFIKGRTTIIACPKLDRANYVEKLTQIFAGNDIRSITVVRMQVPCCGGLDYMVRLAVQNCGKDIPVETVIIGMDGKIKA